MVIIWTFSICAKKIFLAKLFVPLIKGSVSPQFYAIFGKLNFWRNIDRRGPYKNGEHLNYLKLCKENIFCQNYLFHSTKEVFLHNFRQFWANWIFEGISTGADLTKMVKICIILNCAKKLFFGKIICSTHQRKSFSTILGNFWKIEILKEYWQARTLQNWWKFELSQFVLRKSFLAKLFVPFIKGSVSPQFYAIFGKLNIEGISIGAHLTKCWKFELSQFVLRKYFLAKEFVPLIKGSVSPQFYAIFGKLNFWRNIDRRGPYKMVKIWTISICAKKIFFGKIIYLTHQKKCFSTILRNF